MTGDHDMLQLIDDRIKIYMAGRNFSQSKLYSSKEVQERYGLKPLQIIDYKALKGDPSDNIPGVKGIGEKTAIELIQKYSNLDNIYQHIDELKPAINNKLKIDKDNAFLSLKIATIEQNATIDLEVGKCKWSPADIDNVEKIFQKLQFKSLLKQLSEILPVSNITNQPSKSEHPKLNINVIEDENQLADIINVINLDKEIIFLCSFDYKDHFNTKLREMAIYLNEEIFVIQREHFDKKDIIFMMIKAVFEDHSIRKVTHGGKAAMHVLMNDAIILKNLYFDSCIAYHLLNYGVKIESLEELIFAQYGKVHKGSDADSGLESTSYKAISVSCYYLWKLYGDLMVNLDKLKLQGKHNLYSLFYEVEMPLVTILFNMERAGIKLDIHQVKSMRDDLESKIHILKQSIFKDIGHEFNLNSSKQVGKILFEELNLPSSKKRN